MSIYSKRPIYMGIKKFRQTILQFFFCDSRIKFSYILKRHIQRELHGKFHLSYRKQTIRMIFAYTIEVQNNNNIILRTQMSIIKRFLKLSVNKIQICQMKMIIFLPFILTNCL